MYICSFLFRTQLSNFFTFMLDHCTNPDAGKNKNQRNMESLFEKTDVRKVNFQFDVYSLWHMLGLRFDFPNTVIRILSCKC